MDDIGNETSIGNIADKLASSTKQMTRHVGNILIAYAKVFVLSGDAMQRETGALNQTKKIFAGYWFQTGCFRQ